MTEQPRGRPGRNGLGGLLGSVADAAVRQVDLDAALQRVDPDEVLDRVDVNRVLDRVDTTRLLDRVDVDRLLSQVDVDRLLEQVDVDRLLEQVDVNRLLDRVDPDRLLDRVDPDRLLDRVDIQRIVERAGITDIVASSTGRVAGSALDSLRWQLVGLDGIVMRLLYGVTGRDLASLPARPAALRRSGGDAPALPRSRAGVNGRYAGLLTRSLAFIGDLALATGLYSAVVGGLGGLAATVFDVELGGGATSGVVFLVGLVTWLGLYWAGTLSLQGRTAGMALLGLRLVARDGRTLAPARVVAWVAVLPFATTFFGAGMLLMLLGEERRTLPDRVAGSAMIYDWGPSGGGQGVVAPLRRWIEQHEHEGPGTDRPSAPSGTQPS